MCGVRCAVNREQAESICSKPFVFNLPGVPSPPINLQITECYDRRTNLSWTPDISRSSEITHYLIEQESNHNPFVFNLIYNVTNPNTTSLTLDLPGWSSLQFRVKAVNDFGPSRPSVATDAGICITPVGCKFRVSQKIKRSFHNSRKTKT